MRHFFLLPVLNVIPFNLVCLHLQRKTAAITTINHSFLAGICIVDHAEPAIFHIGMYFHIEVGTEPLMQILLSVSLYITAEVLSVSVSRLVISFRGITCSLQICSAWKKKPDLL